MPQPPPVKKTTGGGYNAGGPPAWPMPADIALLEFQQKHFKLREVRAAEERPAEEEVTATGGGSASQPQAFDPDDSQAVHPGAFGSAVGAATGGVPGPAATAGGSAGGAGGAPTRRHHWRDAVLPDGHVLQCGLQQLAGCIAS